MGRYFLLFLTTVALELVLLGRLARLLGPWSVVGLLTVTTLVGFLLIKRAGFGVLRQISSGRGPVADEMLSGVLMLAGGILLVLPGLVTDVAGLLLLIPFTRRPIARSLRGAFERRVQSGSLHVATGHRPRREPPARDQVIDADVVRDR